MAKTTIHSTSIDEIKLSVSELFDKQHDCKLEYFEIADADTLNSIQNADEHTSIVALIAGYTGKIRLIDNLILIP